MRVDFLCKERLFSCVVITHPHPAQLLAGDAVKVLVKTL